MESSDVSRKPIPGVYLGCLAGLRFYLSWSLCAAIPVMLGGAWLLSGTEGNSDLPMLAGCIWICIVSVGLIQDLVHAMASKLLGGRGRSVVMAAHGGAGRYAVVRGFRQIIVALSGPLATAAGALLVALTVSDGADLTVLRLINPLHPPGLIGSITLVNLAAVWTWTAMALSLVQLLPIWQCDGRAVLDGLISMRWPTAKLAQRESIVSRVTLALAAAIVGASVVMIWTDPPIPGAPRWPFVATLGVVLWLSGSRTDPRLISMEQKDKRIGLRGWFRIRRAQNLEKQEAVDASQLDEILDRLHRGGMESLSVAEKAVLRRVSRNLKQRQT